MKQLEWYFIKPDEKCNFIQSTSALSFLIKHFDLPLRTTEGLVGNTMCSSYKKRRKEL